MSHEHPSKEQKEKIYEILKPYTTIEKEKNQWIEEKKKELQKGKNSFNQRQIDMLHDKLLDETFKVRFPEFFNIPEERNARLI
jgi:hypothetical protein